MAFGKKKSKYYSLDRIDATGAVYRMVIGQRSNGKTYAGFLKAVKAYAKDKTQTALIRRWREDFIGKRGSVMFDALVANNEISKATNGEWTGVKYYSSKWFFTRQEGDKIIVDEDPFCFAFSLSEMEHDKSTSYPSVKIIVFDEFLSRLAYIPDEFVLFCNVISTIIRGRTDVVIYMFGNTVNKYCPYFSEMGLNHVKQQQPDSVDVYTYGDSQLTVAVEYAPEMQKDKNNNDYFFAFDNPKLKMITSGAWEIDIYPHLPMKYKPKNIIFTYFIEFSGDLLQCEIIRKDDVMFTFIHRKTTPLQDETKDIIYTTRTEPRFNIRRNLLKPVDGLDKKIAAFFAGYKVFYQDNEVGEIMRNYLMWCKNKA